MLKDREGYFHCFGNEVHWDNESNSGWIQRVIGVVEEISTGQVYHVIPKRIKFITKKEKEKK